MNIVNTLQLVLHYILSIIVLCVKQLQLSNAETRLLLFSFLFAGFAFLVLEEGVQPETAVYTIAQIITTIGQRLKARSHETPCESKQNCGFAMFRFVHGAKLRIWRCSAA